MRACPVIDFCVSFKYSNKHQQAYYINIIYGRLILLISDVIFWSFCHQT